MVGTCRHLVAVGRTTGYRDWCWTLVENARADKAGVGYGVTRTISRLICHVIATVLATFLAALATLSATDTGTIITAVTCAVAWTKSGGFTAFTSVKRCQISQTQFIKGSAWKKGISFRLFLKIIGDLFSEYGIIFCSIKIKNYFQNALCYIFTKLCQGYLCAVTQRSQNLSRKHQIYLTKCLIHNFY